MRNELLEQQQEEKAELPYVEDQKLKDEVILEEADILEDPNIPDISIDLLEEDADIFRKLNIPRIPSDMQGASTEKAFHSDMENLQRTVRQYRHQMDYMQEVNDGMILANR